MKRAAELVALSRQHHEALVLARRAREPQRPGAQPQALRAHLIARWAAHFEPHFACEERVLLPALATAGAGEDAAAALAQHTQLRQLMQRIAQGELAALPLWGDAMQRHVKWEEQHLFPRAEALLELSRLAAGLQEQAT
jgi:hemerythrin-like domain-containing protein